MERYRQSLDRTALKTFEDNHELMDELVDTVKKRTESEELLTVLELDMEAAGNKAREDLVKEYEDLDPKEKKKVSRPNENDQWKAAEAAQEPFRKKIVSTQRYIKELGLLIEAHSFRVNVNNAYLYYLARARGDIGSPEERFTEGFTPGPGNDLPL